MNPSADMVSIDPGELAPRELYALHISALLPRPIAWVSTVNAAGIRNLAPFSFFGGVTSDPPIMSLGIGSRRGVEKDSLANIRATGEFVINMVDEELAPSMVLTSGDFPAGVDEFEIAGIESAPSSKVRPPRVKRSPVAMECRVERILRVGRSGGHLVLGEAVFFHVRRDLWVGGQVSPEGFRPVARLGSTAYAKMGEIFHSPRPDWRAILEGHAGGTVHDP